MIDTTKQWVECSSIANDCKAQFVGHNNIYAAMFCRIAIEFQMACGVWR